MRLAAPAETGPEHVRTYLRLTHLLDGIQQDYPQVSAPLRLTLLRARRDGQIGSLDEGSFRAVVTALRTGHEATP